MLAPIDIYVPLATITDRIGLGPKSYLLIDRCQLTLPLLIFTCYFSYSTHHIYTSHLLRILYLMLNLVTSLSLLESE